MQVSLLAQAYSIRITVRIEAKLKSICPCRNVPTQQKAAFEDYTGSTEEEELGLTYIQG